MGSFYTNLTFCSPDQNAVAAAFAAGGYHAYPGDFVEDDAAASGRNVPLLCEAFGTPGNSVKVEQVLHAGFDDDSFALERHADLAKALGWPELELHQGFPYVSQEGMPPNWREIP